jgi:hypothetical protein
VGWELGWAGSVGPEAARRRAYDAALTRVLVTRGHPTHPDGDHGSDGPASGSDGERLSLAVCNACGHALSF